MIGIFGQTREDVATLLDNVEVVERKRIGSMTIYNVTYNNHNFYIIVSGVGKANAAFSLGYALTKLCVKKVIVVGNTASLISETVPNGSVAIATSSIEWDVNFINLGYPANTVPDNSVSQYPTDAVLQRSALEASTGLGYATNTGLFASGDTFVASGAQSEQINTATGALFLDINTAPIGQISYQMNVPYISVKGVSNYATEEAITEYNANRMAANNLSNRVVLEMLNSLFNVEEEEETLCCEGTNTNGTANTTFTTIACPCNMYCNSCNQWSLFNNGCNTCNNTRNNNFWNWFW